MDDEWIFQSLGAIGATLTRDPSPDARDALSLSFEFPPGEAGRIHPSVARPVESPDVDGLGDEEAADVVEQRLSRHFSVKRMHGRSRPGLVREWALSERSASPGFDQPTS